MKNKLKKTTAALLAAALVVGGVPASEGKGTFGGLGTCVDAYASTIDGGTIKLSGESGTVSSDMTCTVFDVFSSSTLTINRGVTVTLDNPGNHFTLMDCSKIELHGTLTGSAGSGAEWWDESYINVYLSDGAKYTVTGLSCMDGANYLRYYGYDAATDGNGTVSVKNGSTDVTSDSVGYKTTSYTYTAAPAEGYKFKNWTKGEGGEVLGTETSINVTCEQNGQYQVYANFEVSEEEKSIADTYQEINATTGWCLNKSGNAVYLIYRLGASEDELKDIDFISILDSQKATLIPSDEIAEGEDGYQGKFNTVYTAVQFPDNSEITAGENEYLIAFELSGITTQPKNFTIITGVNE